MQRTSLPGDARRQDLPRGSQVLPGSRNVVAISYDRGTAPPRSETAKPRPGGRKATVELRTPSAFQGGEVSSVMILPQVHLRKPCYDFYFL